MRLFTDQEAPSQAKLDMSVMEADRTEVTLAVRCTGRGLVNAQASFGLFKSEESAQNDAGRVPQDCAASETGALAFAVSRAISSARQDERTGQRRQAIPARLSGCGGPADVVEQRRRRQAAHRPFGAGPQRHHPGRCGHVSADLANAGRLDRSARGHDRDQCGAICGKRSGAGAGPDRSVGTRWCEGYTLLDPLGQKLGRVERVFCNRGDEPQYVRIRIGVLLRKLVLIPVMDVAVDPERQSITLR